VAYFYLKICVSLPSVIRGDKFSFPIAQTDIDRELRFESEVRTNEVFTVNNSIIIKKFASFKKEPFKLLTEIIKDNISVE